MRRHVGDPADPCAKVTCSNHGTCAAVGGIASCECDAGFHSDGLTCVGSLQYCGLGFSKRVDIASAARPEIIATANRVFVVYLSFVNMNRTFVVNVYDSDMSTLVASRTIVGGDSTYGQPTDIRVASDGQFAYAFYQTVNNLTNSAYLWGTKYSLDDLFEQKAATGLLASGLASPLDGDEKTDDAIALTAHGKVFAITRYKASFDASNATRYKVREFSIDLVPAQPFDVDLSSVADGGARQASAVAIGDSVYMAVPSTNGTASVADLATISDIVVVQLDASWSIVAAKNVSTDHTDVETYATGLDQANGDFFVTYNRRAGADFSSPLVVLDANLDLLDTVVVRQKQTTEIGLRPSLRLDGNRILVGADSNTGPGNPPSAEIYIYTIDWRYGACL